MGGLQDAIKAASVRVAEEHQKLIRDRRIQYASDVYGFATAYDSAIIIAGYAAFFALWAGTSGGVHTFARLVTVGLMGISLILYVAWHILQMTTRQKFEFERADTFEFEQDAVRFNDAWEDIDRRWGIAQMRIMRWWPFIFLPSVGFGFASGSVLSYNALAAAFGWPQLTGVWR